MKLSCWLNSARQLRGAGRIRVDALHGIIAFSLTLARLLLVQIGRAAQRDLVSPEFLGTGGP